MSGQLSLVQRDLLRMMAREGVYMYQRSPWLDRVFRKESDRTTSPAHRRVTSRTVESLVKKSLLRLELIVGEGCEWWLTENGREAGHR